MAHFSFEDLKKMIPGKIDEEFIAALSKGVLKLTQDEINTLMFVFFLCHIAERDIAAVFEGTFEKLSKITTPEVLQKSKEQINEFISGKKFTEPMLEDLLKELPEDMRDKIRASVKDRYREKSMLDIDNLQTFGEKVLAYQTIYSENNVSKILWKLKKIRDDISHGRILELTYEKESLMQRSTKEKLFFDYMNAVNQPEHQKSGLRDHIKLTEEQKNRMEEMEKLLD